MGTQNKGALLRFQYQRRYLFTLAYEAKTTADFTYYAELLVICESAAIKNILEGRYVLSLPITAYT